MITFITVMEESVRDVIVNYCIAIFSRQLHLTFIASTTFPKLRGQRSSPFIRRIHASRRSETCAGNSASKANEEQGRYLQHVCNLQSVELGAYFPAGSLGIYLWMMRDGDISSGGRYICPPPLLSTAVIQISFIRDIYISDLNMQFGACATSQC